MITILPKKRIKEKFKEDKIEFIDYPRYDDPLFYEKIANKLEFQKYKTDKRIAKKDPLELYFPHQNLIKNFINPYTPYERIFLFHDVGTGKTCSAIAIAEEFIRDAAKNNIEQKIFVLTSKSVSSNFKDELLHQCTKNRYVNPEDFKKFYKFEHYDTFVNKVIGKDYKGTMDQDIYDDYDEDIESKNIENVDEYIESVTKQRILDTIKYQNLNGYIIIVDEVHNMLFGDRYLALKKIIDNSINIRLILLSATPMYNGVFSIVKLMNLLNPKNNLPQKETIFISDYFFIEKRPDVDPSKLILGGNKKISIQNRHVDPAKVKPEMKDKLLETFKGYISYIRAYNPFLFPEKRFKRDDFRTSIPYNHLNLIALKLSNLQLKLYIKSDPNNVSIHNRKNLSKILIFGFPNMKINNVLKDYFKVETTNCKTSDDFYGNFYCLFIPINSAFNIKAINNDDLELIFGKDTYEFLVSENIININSIETQLYLDDQNYIYKQDPDINDINKLTELSNKYRNNIIIGKIKNKNNDNDKDKDKNDVYLYNRPIITQLKCIHPFTKIMIHGFLNIKHLKNYSPKFYYILNRILGSLPENLYGRKRNTKSKNYPVPIKEFENGLTPNGPIFVYLEDVVDSGVILFTKMLEANGFVNYVTHTDTNYPKYLLITGDSQYTHLNRISSYRKIFNDVDNLFGKNIKVIIGTKTMSEGITLKNVRQIHIVEPWWNFSRLDQIIGRGVRSGSHEHLYNKFFIPSNYSSYKSYNKNILLRNLADLLNNNFIDANEWNELKYSIQKDITPENYNYIYNYFNKLKYERSYVDIYRYSMRGVYDEKNNFDTMDEIKYMISFKKDWRIKSVERLLKRSAVDCILNYKRNEIDDDPNVHMVKRECDYQYPCKYDCYGISKDFLFDNKNLDKSTYSFHFDDYNILNAAKTIASMFEKNYVYSLQDINNYVKNNYPSIEDYIIYEALNILLKSDNQIPIYDIYNNIGQINYQDGYYVFTPKKIMQKYNQFVGTTYRTQPPISTLILDKDKDKNKDSRSTRQFIIQQIAKNKPIQTMDNILNQLKVVAQDDIEQLYNILKNIDVGVIKNREYLIELIKGLILVNLNKIDQIKNTDIKKYVINLERNYLLVLKILNKLKIIFPNLFNQSNQSNQFIGYYDMIKNYLIWDDIVNDWKQLETKDVNKVIKYFKTLDVDLMTLSIKKDYVQIEDTLEGIINFFDNNPNIMVIGINEPKGNTRIFKLITRQNAEELKLKTRDKKKIGKSILSLTVENPEKNTKDEIKVIKGRNCYDYDVNQTLTPIIDNMKIKNIDDNTIFTAESAKKWFIQLPENNPIRIKNKRKVKDFYCYLIKNELERLSDVHKIDLIINRNFST